MFKTRVEMLTNVCSVSNPMWKIPHHQNPDTDIGNIMSTQETDR